MVNPNIMSLRYASPKINDIFSEVGRNILEREFWVAVMKAQKDLGVDIPSEDIEKFEAAKDDVNLALIEEIERRTRHDIKAKIEAFVRTAGASQHLHKGMTSRDLTDNVELIQSRKASEIILGKYVSVLRHLLDRANDYQDVVLTARTHHQAAQPTLLGRRFSMWAEELLPEIARFEAFIHEFPFRGIKGPVGTQFDMLNLFGSQFKAEELERRVASHFGFSRILNSTGQVYPRSIDYALVSLLSQLSAAPENFAKTMRLIAGYDLVTEGFKEDQVGSSAMPHKMNTRTSERINGFGNLIKMYADGASRLSGDQWEEGDVSCSVQRRVIIPDAFYASDGLCEATLTVLNEMGAYPVIIGKEVDKFLPFLATTEILMAAVKAGMGREQAHAVIKRHSVATALKMRTEGVEGNDLADKLGQDPDFSSIGLSSDRIHRILSDKAHFVGLAREQIRAVREEAALYLDKYSSEASYEPGYIL